LKVIEVRQDPNRTPHLALVAGAKGKRWIYATQGMKAGQIISTSSHIPKYPTPGIEGNAYPLGMRTLNFFLINFIFRSSFGRDSR